ncbi:MAG: reverse transcriptase domain-containing protein [Candidatus Sungbacteria bacterium]|nr:reverse transcriptase domain-containing protein [Candidatus Sungbacteria bacterium]
MKIYTDIFQRIVSLESLLDAWDEFKKGKRNKYDVQLFERHLGDNLFELHENLISKQYHHGAYSSFYIRDPKIRLIHKSMVRDRIVHHAVFKTLNEIFEPTFIFDSYSCRKCKGTHRGVERLRVFVERTQRLHGKCFVLKCDIRKFFHSINHAILLHIIAKRIKDADTLWLIKVLIESFSSEEQSQERERERERVRGAPIGNLTSQLFANVYLNELDQFIKHKLRVKYYIRYSDDFVIVHNDSEYLVQIKSAIKKFLCSKLKLKLHPDKVSLRKYRQGIDFLGYVALPHARMLRTKTKKRMVKKIRERIAEFKNGKLSEPRLLQTINSYFGVLSHANSYKFRQDITHLIWHSLKSPDNT